MATKKKWSVVGVFTTTKHLGYVEAATKEEAEELAGDLDADITVCHQCSRAPGGTGGNDFSLDEVVVEEEEE